MKPTLVILAAGMGSRYGGLKQIDPIGPSGEAIMDYSVYDAIRGGFGRILFVIRPEMEQAFRRKICRPLEGRIAVDLAFQTPDMYLGNFPLPENRQKPWGTGHAVLVAQSLIQTPFAVMNADDYYGPRALKAMAAHLSANNGHHAMVGYRLGQTLSDSGHVARGICNLDDQGCLTRVVERLRIVRSGTRAVWLDDGDQPHPLGSDSLTSMNFWGFQPSILPALEELFAAFLARSGTQPKAEFLLPDIVNQLIEDGRAKVRVLDTPERWFGVTWREDKPMVMQAIAEMVNQGLYPESLWGVHEDTP